VVPILVGLGIADLDAIRVAALANNAPVSYGALGTPVIGLALVTGLPLFALSASIGNVVAILALLPPWVLIYLVSGWEGMLEAWPLAIVGSLSFIAGQWPVAHYLGPYLPDLSGALISFWVLFVFVKMWRPKTIRGFGGAPLITPTATTPNSAAIASVREAFYAWFPYLVLILVVVGWTNPWSPLPSISLFKWIVTAKSSVTHGPIASTFNFAPLGGGTSTLASWLVILAILRPSPRQVGQVFSRTFKQMWGALLVAFFVFALAYTFVYTGMANSLAFGLSKIGIFFVVLAPILGWIGVALSGSNTSTNAMFGPVQAMTGRLLHLPVLLMPTLNSVGSEVGKPIAPQTASVGVSTSKLVRSEGQVIRHNMGWTLILLAYLILISMLFYYFFPNSMSL
jgi:lactate permease